MQKLSRGGKFGTLRKQETQDALRWQVQDGEGWEVSILEREYRDWDRWSVRKGGDEELWERSERDDKQSDARDFKREGVD